MRRTALAAAAVLAVTACGQESPDDAGDGAAASPSPTVDGDVFEPDETSEPSAPDGDGPVAGPDGGLEQPEWAGPPQDEIGAAAALDPVLFEGQDTVVALNGATVYSTGATLHVAIRTDPAAAADGAPQGGGPLGMGPDGPTGDAGDLPDDLLRLAVVYPDGASASTTQDVAQGGDEPEPPLLRSRQGSGTSTAYDYDLWLWPLPTTDDAPVQLVVEWPSEGIDRTSEELDVAALSEASQEVIQPWTG